MKLKKYIKLLLILIFFMCICKINNKCEAIMINGTNENNFQNQEETNKIKIRYNARYDGKIVVTLESDESINNLDDWVLSEDKLKLTKDYTTNQTENIQVTTTHGEVINVMIQTPSTVVFVGKSGDDANNGDTTGSMVQTLTKCYEKIGDNTGIIVICGDYTVEENFVDQTITFPEHKQKIIITGTYINSNNTNMNKIKFRYQEKNQKDNKAYSARLLFNGPTVLENLYIYSTGTIYAQGNDFTIGENVDNYYKPSIYGGFFVNGESPAEVSASGYSIEINSGRWSNIIASNFRYNENQNFGKVGDVKLVINGGEIIGNVAVGGYSEQSGDYKLKITGGTFWANIYGAYSTGRANTKYLPTKSGNVEIEITGGTFKNSDTKICAMFNTKEVPITGNYKLKITDGATFESIDKLTISAENVEGTVNAIVPENLISKLSCFGSNIFVSNEGDDNNSGLSADKPVKTLSKAFEKLEQHGGTIILCQNVNCSEVELKQCKKKVVITSIFDERDYEGTLCLNGNIKFNSEVVFENIALTASSEKIINANGNNLTIGKNVRSSLNIIIDGGESENSHTIKIESGTWNKIVGGQVTIKKEYNIIKILGGEVNSIYGTGSKGSTGSVNIIIEGGVIENIYEGRDGGKIKQNAGILILDSHNNFNVNNADERYIISDYRLNVPTQENVFFVKDDITENLENSLNNRYVTISELKDTDITTDTTIVICGKTTINSLRIPNKGKIRITSEYNGIDYRKINDAEIMLASLACTGPMEVKKVNILATTDSSYISVRGNTANFGEDINCDVWFEKGVKTYPSIIGGVMSGEDTNKAPDITIKSGTWGNVIGGNGNNKDMKNDINIKIEGGTFNECIKAGNMGDMTGNITLDISAGEFNCPIYGIPYSTSLYTETSSMTGNITINITGGTFCGVINAKEGYTIDSNGENIIKFNENNGEYKYVLNINNGDFRRISQIKGLSDGKSQLNIANSINIDAEIDTTIEYKNPIEYYPDSQIMYLNGWYYFSYKGYYGYDEAIYVKKAANICDIGNATPILVYHTDRIWGPRLYNFNGETYIYMLDMEEGASVYGVPMVLKAIDPNNPQGEYEEPIALRYKYEDGKTIELTHELTIDNVYEWLMPKLFMYNDKLYMSCGGITQDTKEKTQNGTLIDSASGKTIKHEQQIFIVEMEDPITIKADTISQKNENGEIVKIDVPVIMESTKTWEGDENSKEIYRVIEGSFPIVNNGELYIMYTGGNATTEGYCTGLLKYVGTNDNLMDPLNWGKYENPILESNVEEKIFSVGGTALISGVMAEPVSFSENGEILEEYSEDGEVIGYSDNGEFIAIFQGKPYANSYWRKRYTYIKKAKWVEETITLEPTIRDSTKEDITITTKVLRFYNATTGEFDINMPEGANTVYTSKANSMPLSNRISDLEVNVIDKTEPTIKISSNNNLSSLSVDGILISNFSKDTLTYTLTEVENDKTSIDISAETEDIKAKVIGTGTKNLNVGKNSFKIVVIAEDGTEKSYEVNVERKAVSINKGDLYNESKDETESPTELPRAGIDFYILFGILGIANIFVIINFIKMKKLSKI